MSQRGMVQKLKPVRTQLIPPKGAVQAGFTHDGKQLWTMKRPMNYPVPYIEAAINEVCGMDSRGNALHEWKDDSIDKPVCNKCGTVGQRVYRTYAHNSERVAVRRPNVVYEEKLFYLEDCGNTNVKMIDYTHPTEAEKLAMQRKEEFKRMGGGPLGKAFVDAGLSIEDIPNILGKMKDMKERPEPEDVVTTGSFEDQAATFTAKPVSEPEDVPEPETFTAETIPQIYPIPDEKGPWWTLSNGKRARGEQTAREAQSEIDAAIKQDAAIAAEASY